MAPVLTRACEPYHARPLFTPAPLPSPPLLSVFAGAFAVAGYRVDHGEPVEGFRLGTASSLALAAGMGMRFVKTRQPMPSGALAALGAASAAYHVMKWQEFAGAA